MNIREKRIALIGLDFSSGNLGCGALSYGFMEVLRRISEDKQVFFKVDIISDVSSKVCEEISSSNVVCTARKLIGSRHFLKKIKFFSKYDYVIDFTAGDSFSDIYGMKRFISRTTTKLAVLFSSARLVLGSQTYGPFKSVFAKWYATIILKSAFFVFARDHDSANLVNSIAGRMPVVTADVAFALPYSTQKNNRSSLCKRIGINVSGLLWSGGYNSNNQFGLSVDYQAYCKQVISALLQQDKTVILVPHVLSQDLTYPDNDLVAIKQLKEIFPMLQVTQIFQNPIEAKSFISDLDLLIGARMHATIAGISSGTPVIPFSYSQKFEGLYNDLGYPFLIEGKKMSTDEAVKKTLEYVNQFDLLSAKQQSIDVDEIVKSLCSAYGQVLLKD